MPKGLDRPFFNLYNKLMNTLNMTPEQAQAFIRKVMGPPKRILKGKERENIWLLIQMSTPVRESNNQRFWHEEYVIGNKRYDVTYGVEDEPIVEVYEDETNT
jgi:hypothetical protein